MSINKNIHKQYTYKSKKKKEKVNILPPNSVSYHQI